MAFETLIEELDKEYERQEERRARENAGKKPPADKNLSEIKQEIKNVDTQLHNLEIGLVLISFVLCLFATFFINKYFRKSNRLLQMILILLIAGSSFTFFYLLTNLILN